MGRPILMSGRRSREGVQGLMALELGEPWPAWHPVVRRASWISQGVEQDVLLVLAEHTPGAVAQVREASVEARSFRGKHVLPLLAVEPVGQKVAWIYPFEVLIALSQLPDCVLGHRGAAEVARDVTRTLLDLDHPGPLPSHVLLSGRGTVRIAHFVGPLCPDSAWTAPGGISVPGADRVYRIGLLFAYLLGTNADEVGGAVEHEAFLRRVVMNAMSLPGASLSDTYRDLLRDTLAWDPRDRPSLSELLHRLDEIVSSTQGESLHELAKNRFSTWMMPHRPQLKPRDAVADLVDVSVLDDETMEEVPGRLRTLDGEGEIGDFEDEDEPTVDSELGIVAHSERTPTSAIEFGSLPLHVGPPPEGVKPTPRLPAGFMGSSETTHTEREGTPSREAPDWLLWTAVLLATLALGMSVWLLFG